MTGRVAFLLSHHIRMSTNSHPSPVIHLPSPNAARVVSQSTAFLKAEGAARVQPTPSGEWKGIGPHRMHKAVARHAKG